MSLLHFGLLYLTIGAPISAIGAWALGRNAANGDRIRKPLEEE